MKKIDRILALALALGMLLALGACGRELSFEEKMGLATEKISALKSQHMNLEMNLSMELAMMGESQPVDMVMRYDMDIQNEPARSRMLMTVDASDEPEELLLYTETENGQTWVYLSGDKGQTWEKTSPEDSGVNMPSNPEQVTELFRKNAQNFEKTGEETINGYHATVYSGTMGEEYAAELMGRSGMGSVLSESMGVGALDGIFEGLGDIPTTIAIDNDSGMIVRYTMDMAEIMETIMKRVFDRVLTAQGLGMLQIEVKVTHCVCTVELSQFDKVPEIVIPEAAKAA